MRLVQCGARAEWKQRVEQQGFDFHTAGGVTYWVDERAYAFTRVEAELIRASTAELHRLCVTAVEHVIRNDWFKDLAISEKCVPLIRKSWEEEDFSLYGRFDLSYDGTNPPKMLEYNADTPTALLESAVIQWYWLDDQRGGLAKSGRLDQFNSLQDKFVQTWKNFRRRYMEAKNLDGSPKYIDPILHLACVEESMEDRKTVEFLAECARHAGIQAQFLYVHDIGWDPERRFFVDLEGRRIHFLFKLYPWEMIVRDEFGDLMMERSIQMIEPAWKMVLSNKGILPILWRLFPDHPNLLPSYFSPEKLGKTYVKKPIFSREGANITIVRDGESSGTGGVYGEEGYIYQTFAPLPKLSDRHMMIGSWVVGHQPAGICIRDSSGLITDNLSCLVPHFVE